MNEWKFKRMIVMLALALAVGVAVTGCMSEGNRGLLLDSETETATPGRPSQAPNATAQNTNGAQGANLVPDATNQNVTGSQNAASGQSATNVQSADGARFDWTGRAAQVEARIAQISEISEARVVTTGDTALVGVKFDRAYQGELTERIREMVAAEVMAADPQIKTVAVTADSDDVGSIYELSERSTLGKDLDTLKEDIEEIVRNATTLR